MTEVDERLVHALCAAAATEPGGAEAAVRAHVGRLAPLAGPVAAEARPHADVLRLSVGLEDVRDLVADLDAQPLELHHERLSRVHEVLHGVLHPATPAR